jgi:hypothetical protein
MGKRAKSVYEGAVFKKREGSITLSSAGIAFKSSDQNTTSEDDDEQPEKMRYRAKWSVIQEFHLNKRSAAKALIKIAILEDDSDEEEDDAQQQQQPQIEHVTFRLPNREELEVFRDDMTERLERYRQKQQARTEPAQESQEGEDMSESMNFSVRDNEVWNRLHESTTDPLDVSESDFRMSTRDEDDPVPLLAPLHEYVKAEEEEEVSEDDEEMAYNLGNDDEEEMVPLTKQPSYTSSPMSHNINKVRMNGDAATTLTSPESDEVPGPTIEVLASTANLNGSIYGTSKYFTPTQGAKLIAEAELERFAPCPCVCCICCVNNKLRKRTYVRAYENRIESNFPWSPCGCCSDGRCMADHIQVYYYDRAPNRIGMCCFCIPCICCGPPVIFSYVPRWCCAIVDCRPCFGEQIKYACCSCYGCRMCGFCGPPCYECWAVPLYTGVLRGETFLAKWKGALIRYRSVRNISEDQGAVFARVADRFCDFDQVQQIEANLMEDR